MLILLGINVFSYLMFMLIAGVSVTTMMIAYSCPLPIAETVTLITGIILYKLDRLALSIPYVIILFLLWLAFGFIVLMLLSRRGILASLSISSRRFTR